MSDEQNPPPPALRLKPRLRPAEGQGAGSAPGVEPSAVSVPPVPAEPAMETPAPEAAPKIRLRPKLSPGVASSPTDVPAVSEVIPPPNPLPPPAPPLFVDPPTLPPTSSRPPLPAPGVPTSASRPPLPTSASKPPMPTSSSQPPMPAPTIGGFKLKPKPPPGAPADAPPVQQLFVTEPPAVEPPTGVEPPVYAPTAPAPKPEKVKTPPPFPVVAKTRPTAAPAAVPHLSLKSEVLQPEPEASAAAPGPKRGPRVALLALAAVVVLGGGGFFAWKHFSAVPPAPPTAVPKATPTAAAPTPAAPANAHPTPSETLNQLAHAPANAIAKAQEALAARRASGQERVDAAALGEDVATKPFGPPPAAPTKAPATQTTTAMTNIAPGLTATTQMEAAPEASLAFRTFVANARVSGVFQGSPARAMINGKLTRVGETVDSSLGISFSGVDADRKSLVFKDKSGATVSRRY